ncbi:MAG: glutamine--fructose-6-phosphate transaminase (isomerizing) [Deltaproteobacteria bacterium]|nr:glutamine--fructose-6-phosphate transaminase (isomerizing) [Deltaproteobacteria bacterium]
MCGIVGYIGQKQAADIILDGLTRLEYRGYDSAGIAILNQKFQIRRAEGKLQKLKELLQTQPAPGILGIGHTRWATHGKPSEANAHPHRSGKVSVVHNGIIENYLELRHEMASEGRRFQSDTDTEMVAHLLDRELKNTTDILEAFYKILKKIRGSYALAILHEDDPDHFYVARYQSPLVVGVGQDENFVASDVPALLPYTRRVLYLEDGDIAKISRKQIEVFNADHQKVSRPLKEIQWSLSQAEKDGYKHFMLKEIFEGPRAFIDTLRGRISKTTGDFPLEGFEKIFKAKNPFNKIYLVACGTSYHAALLGKFYLEKFVKIPVIVDTASEFRYRDPILDEKTLMICISQSGETADTLVAVKNARQKKTKVLSICNVLDASIPRDSDAVFYTHAGPEIGVAATKTFITQMEAILLIALSLGRQYGQISKKDAIEFIEELSMLPQKMEMILRQQDSIRKIALRYEKSSYFLFVGRGLQFPIALEGALKLKEISYINAEGYAAGELKHGPIAMIDQGTPVVALVPQDESYEKMLSNIQEVLARGAALIAIGNEEDTNLADKADDFISIPKTIPIFYPLLTVIPLQLISYEIANHKGHDVDQPRNLAKSVTVE